MNVSSLFWCNGVCSSLHLLLRRENTKFIVTLEGVDTDVFEMRDDPPDIRSRLGARPIRSDSLEEVEVRLICVTLA